MTLGDEELGGDPACWAHLFDDETCLSDVVADDASATSSLFVDLLAVAHTGDEAGAAWSHQSQDLDVNLVVFANGDGVEAHVNAEVDVLVVGIAGDGIVEIDGTFRPFRAGQAIVIPRGARRGFRGASDRFAYLSCHRRRVGLWPTPNTRSRD
jgi:quercetin dioxygenase-like cupin family protein